MRPSLLAGLGAGLATGAWMFGEYALGLHDSPSGAGRWTGFLSLIFPLAGAYWLAKKAAGRAWTHVLGEGLIFGATGGVVGGLAIYVYFAFVNPGFTVGGREVDAVAQAVAGFGGSLVLGLVLTLAMYLAVGRRTKAGQAGNR